MKRRVTVSEQVGCHSADEAVEAAYRLAESHGIATIEHLEVGAASVFETHGGGGTAFLWDVEVSGRTKDAE